MHKNEVQGKMHISREQDLARNLFSHFSLTLLNGLENGSILPKPKKKIIEEYILKQRMALHQQITVTNEKQKGK